MVQRNRLFVPIFLISLAACLFAVPLWSRLPENPAMVDVKYLAERDPMVFRGRVMTVAPDKIDERNGLMIDGKRVNTSFVARFQIDRLYRGKLPGEVLLHFGYGGFVAMGHDCIDFQPNQYWLVFATEKSDALKLFDDCSGALGIRGSSNNTNWRIDYHLTAIIRRTIKTLNKSTWVHRLSQPSVYLSVFLSAFVHALVFLVRSKLSTSPLSLL